MAEDVRIWLALPVETNDLALSDHLLTVVANGEPFAIIADRTKLFELLLSEELDVFDYFPVNKDFDAL